MIKFTPDVLLGDYAVSMMNMYLPDSGVWYADCEVLADDTLSGELVLDINGTTFLGAVVRSDVQGALVSCRVVGGKGAWSSVVEAKDFNSASVKILLEDACQASGQLVDGTLSDSASMSQQVLTWSRMSATLLQEVERITTLVAKTWYVSNDGKIVLGSRPSTNIPELLEVKIRADLGYVDVVLDDLTASPSFSYNGKKVVQIQHVLQEQHLTQRLMLE